MTLHREIHLEDEIGAALAAAGWLHDPATPCGKTARSLSCATASAWSACPREFAQLIASTARAVLAD